MGDNLNGADYRARVRLSTKDDQTLALAGETCARVPASSLPFLLASRKIEAIAVVAPVVDVPHVPTEEERADLGRPADAEEM